MAGWGFADWLFIQYGCICLALTLWFYMKIIPPSAVSCQLSAVVPSQPAEGRVFTGFLFPALGFCSVLRIYLFTKCPNPWESVSLTGRSKYVEPLQCSPDTPTTCSSNYRQALQETRWAGAAENFRMYSPKGPLQVFHPKSREEARTNSLLRSAPTLTLALCFSG